MCRDGNTLAATVAEGLGKLLMHNHVWGSVGLGSLEQGDTVKVCRVSKQATSCYAHALSCASEDVKHRNPTPYCPAALCRS